VATNPDMEEIVEPDDDWNQSILGIANFIMQGWRIHSYHGDVCVFTGFKATKLNPVEV
jgi:hypothetical protein